MEGAGDVHTPKGAGQTRRHGKCRHLKANGNQNGNGGTSGTVACRAERSCLVCTTEVEMCAWPGMAGGQ